jgi:SPP1 gp7 family putative phage head morphogenesis protein
VSSPLSLKPKDAFAYFRQKGLAPSFAWQDVWQDEHARAFTAAKMLERDTLEFTYDQVSRAVSGEANFAAVAADLVAGWKKLGWWGVQELKDPLTGKVRPVQLGSKKRAMFIIETNVRVAQAAGRWSRLQANKQYAPYLMYVSRMDGRERPQHHAWHGTILPIDDPWWRTHYPPCGWNCRCRVIAFSARELAARGLKVTEKPIKFAPKPYTNPRTGEIILIEEGIDPGWSHNVGMSPLRGLTAHAPLSGGAAPAQIKDGAKAFLTPLKAADKGRIIQDKDKWPIAVGPDMFVDAAGAAAVPRPDLIHRLGDVGRALAAPDRAEWIWRESGGGAPIDGPEAIGAQVKKAMADRRDTSVARIGATPAWLNEAARAQGIDVFDYAHTLDSASIRHILQAHGDASAEALRGQIAVTAADLEKLPQILAHPDLIAFGLTDRAGRPGFALVKDAGDGTWVYVLNINRGRWQLAAKTLWRWKGNFSAATDATEIVRSLDLYGQTGGGAAPKIVDLRGKINAAGESWPKTKASLIRRYTKALDGEIVTIDFARDTWTFDISQNAAAKRR